MTTVESSLSSGRGLATTLELLGKTNNEAAVDVLVAGLDAADEKIQQGALAALLDRRSPRGQREILARLADASPSWRATIDADKGRLDFALRDAVLGADPQLCNNACQAILWFREYDLVPVLLTALEDGTNPRASLAATTLLALADTLYADGSAAPRDYQGRRDPQLIQQRVLGSLEGSLRRFSQHQRADVVNAFLLLTKRDNVTLKQILQDTTHSAFPTLIEALLKNERSGVIQLLLSFLEDPHAPMPAIAVIARRRDSKFVRALLRKATHPFSPIAAKNLKRIESLAWLSAEPEDLSRFDEIEQQALVPLIVTSGLRRSDVFQIIEQLVNDGKPGGRIAAIKALDHFSGAEANRLVVHALTNDDPQAMAAVLPLIRRRGMPGALNRLIELIDSPHACVRQAASESLAELSFERYLAAFDLLEDDVRQTIGALVCKLDQRSLKLLANELRVRSRPRRLRALAVAAAMGLTPRLEMALVELLCDSDHLVRAEAARSLRHCRTVTARNALQAALDDRRPSVVEAAQESLESLANHVIHPSTEASQ